MILFFPLSVLKRRSTLLQSKIIKADNGNPGFFGNWFFLWKFDGVDSRWNVFCVNRWHSNRYYTINQGTEQRKDTKLKLSTQTAGILVSVGSLEFTTNDFPEGKLRSACANPELPCTHQNGKTSRQRLQSCYSKTFCSGRHKCKVNLTKQLF